MYKNKVCEHSEEVRKAVLWVAVKATLKYGVKFNDPLERLLPLWKETLLYDKGIFLGKQIFIDCSPKHKVRAELKKMNSIGPKPYDRDFFEGLFDACAKIYSNGTYQRAEIIHRNHIVNFLKSDDHGQHITAIDYVSKKVSRTCNMPFMEVGANGDQESYFFGLLCGSSKYVDDDGEIWLMSKKANRSYLDRLGIIYDETKFGIRISPFYLFLFLDDIPQEILDYWYEELPLNKIKPLHYASIVSAMHWELMYKNKKRVRDAFPFLLPSTLAWNVGINRTNVKEEMSRKRFDFVDERIINRCLRWMRLNERRDAERQGEYSYD